MEQTKTIKTENGELYVQGDKIVGRMEIKGNITRYYKGDKLHRDGDPPASIERNNDGVVIREVYYRDGKQHRDGDLPAHIERIDAQYLAERFAEQSINGVVRYEMYYRDGKVHRDGGLPAVIKRNAAGVVIHECYYRDDEFHREGDLPAIIGRNDAQTINGVVTYEAYYCGGSRHRDGGLPAYISRNNTGAVTREKYYRNGTRIALEQILLEEKEQESVAVIEKLTQEVAAEHAKNAELQSQLDQLRQKIKAIVE